MMQSLKSCQAAKSVEISATPSIQSENKSCKRETFPGKICHTENRGQIHCPSEWKPALRLETSGHPEPGDRSLRRQLRLLHSPDLKDSSSLPNRDSPVWRGHPCPREPVFRCSSGGTEDHVR